ATRRRDFTMNSMLIDLHTGELIDHHNGQRDLASHILRATSEAYMEDPLRVLRGFQFVARYNVWPTSETITMSQHMLAEAKTLSTERIWGEWFKWASRGWVYPASLEYLFATDWISLWPELMALKGVEQDPEWHPEGDVWTHTGKVVKNASDIANLMGYMTEPRVHLIFAALLHDIGKPSTSEISKTSGRMIHPKHEVVGADMAFNFLVKIGAPTSVTNKVVPMVQEHMFRRGKALEHITKRSIRRLSVRVHPASIKELAMLVNADAMGRVGDIDPFVAEMLRVAAEVKVEDEAPKGILKGKHLIERGLSPGPKFGVILKAAYEAQLDGEFRSEYGAKMWLDEYIKHIWNVHNHG
ncbi:MAG: HD domain-containing protein, partial [Candidatus Thorarchaeota archaeon]